MAARASLFVLPRDESSVFPPRARASKRRWFKHRLRSVLITTLALCQPLCRRGRKMGGWQTDRQTTVWATALVVQHLRLPGLLKAQTWRKIHIENIGRLCVLFIHSAPTFTLPSFFGCPCFNANILQSLCDGDVGEVFSYSIGDEKKSKSGGRKVILRFTSKERKTKTVKLPI